MSRQEENPVCRPTPRILTFRKYWYAFREYDEAMTALQKLLDYGVVTIEEGHRIVDRMEAKVPKEIK